MKITLIWLILILISVSASGVSSKTHYIHTDHLGTPIVMTDQFRQVAWRADYSPFGKASIRDGATAELNLRFPGQYFDLETGLHHNYYRDYDPVTGRYLQSDPIGLGGGINTYAYALANPVSFTDRFGLWVQRCARKLGSQFNAPMKPSGNPFRHDYISVSGKTYSFQAGGSGLRNMLGSQGWVDNVNELPTNDKCVTLCNDDRFDKYVIAASVLVGEPKYCVIPGIPGRRNCQTWANDVIKLAKNNYLMNESCPSCFLGESKRKFDPFNPDFARAL